MSIAIVGAGALGSHAALFLRNMKLKIHVFDFDRIEKKNVMAQFHTNLGIGRNKAEALKQAMRGMFGVDITSNPNKVIKDNIGLLICNDLVIDCTDNISARALIQDHCKESDTPCLHGCLSADGSFARVMWTEDFVPDAEGEEGEATCEDGEMLAFFGFVGAFIALEVERFLNTGKKQSTQLTPAGILRLT